MIDSVLEPVTADAGFSTEQMELFGALIKEKLNIADDLILRDKNQVSWEDKLTLWNNHDSWDQMVFVQIVPTVLDSCDLRDLEKGAIIVPADQYTGNFRLSSKAAELFNHIAENAREFWTRKRTHYRIKLAPYDLKYHVFVNYTMVARDPFGIGTDVLVEFQDYNDDT